MFIIVKGQAEIVLTDQTGTEQVVATLSSGDPFGYSELIKVIVSTLSVNFCRGLSTLETLGVRTTSWSALKFKTQTAFFPWESETFFLANCRTGTTT